MPEFLVEVYVPSSGAADVREAVARARASAAQLSAEGMSVRYVRAIFVPEDETCFHVFEASTSEAVRRAGERAAFPAQRIVQSVGIRPGIKIEPEGRIE
jgi:Protein of unknown function (DUF4242)